MQINNDIIDALDDTPEQEAYFTWSGCDNCNNGLGTDVYDCKAHINLTTTEHDYYDIKLCGMCLCAYYNGDELDDDCQNVYKI